MAIVLNLAVLVVLLVIAYVLVCKLNRNREEVRDLPQLVAEHERDRLTAKCNGLFARLLRALHKEEVYVIHTRAEFNVINLKLGGATISVAVRENLGAFETGQLIAFADGYPMIYSCEEEINIFARLIRQALTELGARRSA